MPTGSGTGKRLTGEERVQMFTLAREGVPTVELLDLPDLEATIAKYQRLKNAALVELPTAMPQKWLNYRDWSRSSRLNTSSGRICGLSKRTYPAGSNCEMCGGEAERLVYHHWDDDNLNLGLWVKVPEQQRGLMDCVARGIIEKYQG